MLPVSPTHALAIARAEEVQRRAERAYLSSTEAAAPSRITTALRTLTRPLQDEARAARTAPTSPAACCA